MGSEIFIVPGAHGWTAPVGVTVVQVECWGPGGSSNQHISAGGGGAYARTDNVPVTPGETYEVYVGRALPTGYSQDSYAWDVCKAAGGQCSYSEGPIFPRCGDGGSPENCVGDVKIGGGKGGEGWSLFLTCGGGGGCAGDRGQDSINSNGVGGAGNYGGGNGGAGGSPGHNGIDPGGGAGGTTTADLISGGQGQVKITW